VFFESLKKIGRKLLKVKQNHYQVRRRSFRGNMAAMGGGCKGTNMRLGIKGYAWSMDLIFGDKLLKYARW
jgi:hypothetical protein